MEDLTQRQIDILKAIIFEYSETGEPVGSDILEKKYKLGVSPATIRNEMVMLAKKGYLKKAHFSSGRIPSSKGFRFYINKLMKEKELSTADEVAYKNSIWDERKETHRLLSQAARVLAHRTGLLSLVSTSTGDVYYSGLPNIYRIDEFLDRDLSQHLFERLEEIKYWGRIIERVEKLNEDIYVILGDEDISDPMYETCASIFSEFEGPTIKGIVGVIGPKRMHYEIITPQVKYFSSLLEEIVKNQTV